MTYFIGLTTTDDWSFAWNERNILRTKNRMKFEEQYMS